MDSSSTEKRLHGEDIKEQPTFDFRVRHALHARLTLFLLLPPPFCWAIWSLPPPPDGGLNCVLPSSQSCEGSRSWLIAANDFISVLTVKGDFSGSSNSGRGKFGAGDEAESGSVSCGEGEGGVETHVDWKRKRMEFCNPWLSGTHLH